MQAENVNNVSLEIAGYPNLFQGSTAWQRWRERVGMRNEIKGESQNEIFKKLKNKEKGKVKLKNKKKGRVKVV